ncbi:hypothetical protein Cabys_1009 [Caldithrix abyssi DSM 13497]|uniref:Uncharacterized protein n=1 Tax=Caldithrix abyssi DSM 13497 TaxID=880073 RepID=A0A1J1C773_CALAY|nr:hypothetical protein Cabys_1009 [Caldithrix abyssi DSM 13497]
MYSECPPNFLRLQHFFQGSKAATKITPNVRKVIFLVDYANHRRKLLNI